MTVNPKKSVSSHHTAARKGQQGASAFRISMGNLCFTFMSVFAFAMILRNSDIAIRHMSYGLRLCAETVIPSLFPFMVISELLVYSGATHALGRLLARPFRFLFGISGDSGCAVLLGALCGFPIGTRTALSLYEQKRIPAEELSHLLTFCNLPSSAFLISAVGISLFQSKRFGILLYAITLLSALCVGILGKFLSRPAAASLFLQKSTKSKETPLPSKGVATFTGAVSSSAMSMLYICAYVVFFSALTGTLEGTLSGISMSKELSALCFGFFEMTGGMSRAADCVSSSAIYLCAFFAGWSGLSVHFQMMSICSKQDISFRPYFAAKLAHGSLNCLFIFLYQLCFGNPLLTEIAL